MKIVYFGIKTPKRIQTVDPLALAAAKAKDRRESTGITFIPLAGEAKSYNFEPFKELEVSKEVGKILLDCAGDIFKNVAQGDDGGKATPEIKSDGYVGAAHAETIEDLEARKKADARGEKGKSAEELIADAKKRAKKKKEDAKAEADKNK